MGEVAAALHRDDKTAAEIAVPAAQLATLIKRTLDDTVSGKIAKVLFEIIWSGGDGDVDALIEARGLKQVSDAEELVAIVTEIIAANPVQVAQYRGGRTKLLGFFVGQVMKASAGKANPRKVNELLRRHLS